MDMQPRPGGWLKVPCRRQGTTVTTTSRTRTRAAEQARKQAARQEAERRRRVLRTGAIVVAALVVAIVAAVAVSLSGGDDEAAPAGKVVVPAGATADGRIAVGAAEAPVTVTVFFDYMCPFCGRFEAANSAALDRLVVSGQVRLDLRPMSFLDRQSDGARYSTRAANAVATVADASPEQAWPLHRALFDNQPKEGTQGLSDSELADIARGIGVRDEVVERFDDAEFTGWVADVTQKAFDSGITGTPTVLVDGHAFTGDLYTEGPLTEAVAAAAAAK